jgi:hypothetical protein
MNVNDFEIRHEDMEYNLNSFEIGDLINPGEVYLLSSVVKDANNKNILLKNLTLPEMKVTYINKDYILVKMDSLWSVDIMVLNKHYS